MDQKTGLFGLLDGIPAHAMVVLGILLALLAPVIPQWSGAGAQSAEAELDRAKAVMELDLEVFQKTQEEERKAQQAAVDASAADAEAQAAAMKALTDGDKARKTALDEKKKALETEHEIDAKTREALDARVSAAGVRGHLLLHWLGRFLLLFGLIIMTLNAEGTRQKVLLVILVIVLFGSLTGVNLGVDAKATLGS